MAVIPDNAYVVPSNSDVEVVHLRARVKELEGFVKAAVQRFGAKIGQVTDDTKINAIVENILREQNCIAWMTNDERVAMQMDIHTRDDRIAGLGAENARLRAMFGSGATDEDWLHMSLVSVVIMTAQEIKANRVAGGDPPQCRQTELLDAAAEYMTELEEVVSPLPKTADGKYVIPFITQIYHPDEPCSPLVISAHNFRWANHGPGTATTSRLVSECYSTPTAALAAKGGE